ncbi:MAG: hypothetical protein ACK4JE_02665 [Endomicrobiia bacterium]
MELNDVIISMKQVYLRKKIKKGEKFAKIYKDFSLDELMHADIISQKILNLGGVKWQKLKK